MIYYFSGTGNSKWTAKRCAKMLNTQAFSMTEEDEIQGEAVGLVFPCYCMATPEFVLNWIKKQDWSQAAYIWAICTCGNSSGRTYSQLKSLIPNFRYGKDLVMPDNCIVFAHKPDKVRALLESAPTRLGDVVDEIRDYHTNADAFKSGLFAKVVTNVSWFGLKVLGENRKTVSADKCVNCYVCADHCPTKNIRNTKGKIEFGDRCTDCYSCIQRCPTQAISFGNICPNDSTRYIHPEADE